MQGIGKNYAEDTCLKNPIDLPAPSAYGGNANAQFENGEILGIDTSTTKENLSMEKDEDPAVISSTKEGSLENGVVRNGPDQGIDDASLSDQEKKDDFPEGGLKGWSVVFGSFCGSFSVFGIINSTAILLEYLSTHQLKDYSPSQVGWIFGVSLFLTFFLGAPIGPIFDAYGPRALIFSGSILLILSTMLLGQCTQYWHFFMVYGVLNGMGGCLINTPCIASIGHYFLVKRGNATGIAMTAGSLGGIIFPLMLQRLFPMLGFAWATRILGFILVVLLVFANLLVRSRLPHKKIPSIGKILPDLTVFKDLPFLFLTMGIFLLEWGIFVPLSYLTPYVVAQGQSTAFSYQIIAIMNAGSVLGRFGAGWAADLIGRLNTLIISVALCVISCLALWLPAKDSTAMAIVFAVLFGCFSGSNLSLAPVCVGQMCKTEHYGQYYATCWMVVSFGTLTSLPIAGQILTANGGDYMGLIIFAGLSYALAGSFLVVARVLAVGWSVKTIY